MSASNFDDAMLLNEQTSSRLAVSKKKISTVALAVTNPSHGVGRGVTQSDK